MEPYLKALHLIFVVTWFAGLFYMVRLLVYHAEARKDTEGRREILISQFRIMEKRLWYGIAWPSVVLVLLTGSVLAMNFWPLTGHPWLVTKLFLVVLLFAYHLSCGCLYRRMGRGEYPLGGNGLRLWNEIPTLFLFAIVFSAVLKNSLDALLGGGGLVLLGGLLWAGVYFYRKIRESLQ